MKTISFLILLLLSIELYGASEDQLKAVFLEKFTHLVEWPKEDKTNFIICIMNDKDFADELRNIYEDKKLNINTAHIIDVSDKEDIPDCKLLFIGKDTKDPTLIINKISNRPILTVSDNKKFIDKNIMINIFFSNKRFKYVINNKAAKEADIKISYLLLRSAHEVLK